MIHIGGKLRGTVNVIPSDSPFKVSNSLRYRGNDEKVFFSLSYYFQLKLRLHNLFEFIQSLLLNIIVNTTKKISFDVIFIYKNVMGPTVHLKFSF